MLNRVRRCRRHRRGNQLGQALVAALAFIGFFAVVAVATLNWASTVQLTVQHTETAESGQALGEGVAAFAAATSGRIDVPCVANGFSHMTFANNDQVVMQTKHCNPPATGALQATSGNCALCILNGVDGPGGNPALEVGGGLTFFGSLNLGAGDVYINGNLHVGFLDSLKVTNNHKLILAGTAQCDFLCTISPTPATNQPRIADPLAGVVPTPSVPGPAKNLPAGSATLSPGLYGGAAGGGNTITGNVKLQDGVYVFTKGITVGANAQLSTVSTGSPGGAILFFACTNYPTPCGAPGGGSPTSLVGNDFSSINLTAPTSGAYDGLAVVFDPHNTGGITFNSLISSPAGFNIVGTVYAPASKLTLNSVLTIFNGNVSMTGAVVDTMNVTGVPVSLAVGGANLISCQVVDSTGFTTANPTDADIRSNGPASAAYGWGRVVTQSACKGGTGIVSFNYGDSGVGNIPPSVTLTTPSSGYIDTGTPAFQGAASNYNGTAAITVVVCPGSSINCPLPTQLTTTTTGGTWTVTPGTAFSDGTYTAQARLKDSFLKTAASGINTFTVDTQAPVVTLTTPANGSSTTSTTPTFGGAAGNAPSDGNAIVVRVCPGLIITCGNPTLLNTNRSGTSWSLISSTLAEGQYIAQAEQTDAAGNTGTSSANTFTIDKTPPVVTLTAPANGGTVNKATPAFSGAAGNSANDLATITVTVCPGNGVNCANPRVLTTSRTGATWTLTTPTPGFADGVYSAQAQQSDAAGNVGFSSVNTFTVSTVIPVVTLTAPANGGLLNTRFPVFSGTASNGGGDSPTVTVNVCAGTAMTCPTPTVLNATRTGTTWSIAATTSMADGTYTARAQQSNSVGNTGFSAATTFTIDATPPAVTLTTPANGGSTNASRPQFTGAAGNAAGDSATVTLTICSGMAMTCPTPTVLAVPRTGATWTASPSSPFADGTYTAQASQTDLAGNTGRSLANTFTIDSVPPTVSATIADVSGNTAGYIHQGGQYYIYANAADNVGVASVTASVGNISTTCGSGCALTTGGGGPWPVNNPGGGSTSYAYRSALQTARNPLAAGSVTYSVTAIDAAGNATTTTPTATVKNAGPSVTAVSSSNANGTIESGDRMSVTFSSALASGTVPLGPATVTFSSTATWGFFCSNYTLSNTTVSIAGLTAGAISTGNTGWITTPRSPCQFFGGSTTETASYPGTLSLSPDQMTVTFTVTGVTCTGTNGGCGSTRTGIAGNLTYTPPAAIGDVAGNSATGSITKNGFMVF